MMSLAEQGQAAEIHRLRRAAEDWLAQRGIDQWPVGAVPLADVQAQVARGEWYVVPDGQRLRGALRLLWSDPLFWQELDRFAAYVHGLVIDRRHAGTGLGAGMLGWVEEQARRAGAPALRLDCAESNPQLRRYYTRLGFGEVGRREFTGSAWFSVVLLEKALR